MSKARASVIAEHEPLIPGPTGETQETLKYQPLPLPPAKRLTWEPFARYCRETDSAYPERMVLYTYRATPFIDRSRTKNDNNIWVGNWRVDGTQEFSLDWLVSGLPAGSGDYKVLACDPMRPGRGHKDLCYTYLSFEDWEAHPPVLDLRELVLDEPKNQRYINWLRARGTNIPELDGMANEAVRELTGLVRETLASKQPDPGSHMAIVEALKTGVSLAGHGPSLAEILALVREMQPKTAADPSAVLLPLMQQQIQAMQEQQKQFMDGQRQTLQAIAEIAARPPLVPSDGPMSRLNEIVMNRAITMLENPQPASDNPWIAFAPAALEAAKELGQGLIAWATRPPAPAPAPPQQRQQANGGQQQVNQAQSRVNPMIEQVAAQLCNMLEHYSGEQFASWLLVGHGRAVLNTVRAQGKDQLMAAMKTHPAVAQFGDQRLSEFLDEFLGWSPEAVE